MAAAGWLPMSQLETQGRFPPAAGILMAIGVLVAFFLSLLIGLGIVVIGFLVGIAGRPKALVVTYRYTAPPGGPA